MKLFVDNLTNIDVSYLDAKRGLVGESWIAGMVLTGELDDQSMICDFGTVKKTAKNWLDEFIDHRLVVPTKMPGIKISRNDQLTTLHFPHPHGGQLVCTAPEQAFCFIDTEEINIPSVSTWLENELNDVVPGQINHLKMNLSTELIGGAFYHYSHGLKKHDGNCQRIAHGHRSKIEIFVDGARQPELEKNWARKWKDIYVGTKEDLHNTKEIDGILHNHYEYTAPQGKFSLSLPSTACYDVSTDTTVEQISSHIANVFLEEQHSVTVKAFEGVGKGAISTHE